MERAISATDANQRFSQVLRDVTNGDSYVVTSRGKPVARVVPVDQEDQVQRVDEMLEFFRQQPRRYSGPWKREDLYD